MEMNNDNSNMIKDTFQEPRKRFWLRSRKRPKSDAISVSSMDISIESDVGKKKKRRRITEVASSIFSSATLGSKQGNNSLHRSFIIQPSSADVSFMENETDTGTLKKKRKNSIENTNNFTLRSWVLDVAKASLEDRSNNPLSRKDIKRQEAIYELYCGENILINELCLLRNFYHEPLMPTGIFTSDELLTLFGSTSDLIEVHTRLKDELLTLRDQGGFTEIVGPTILNWIPTLRKPYLERCRSQIWAKHLLDEKRLTNKRFQSFLKKRLESPHSVDLWTYIDVARSRIVKYPLLVKEILRHIPASHTDQTSLKEAYDMLLELLKSIDNIMGNTECKLAQSKIFVKVDYDVTKCIENATQLITEGQLKDTRGMKLQCFLFNTGFAITRGTRHTNKKYNLCFPVIPKEEFCIDAEEKSYTNTGFKIGDHYLITEDGHGKRHWIDSFNKIDHCRNDSSKDVPGNEKENRPNTIKSRKTNIRSSVGSICESNFSLTLKKTLLKQKRNSIGYT